jgi:ActR/RegA family two-component response regulator
MPRKILIAKSDNAKRNDLVRQVHRALKAMQPDIIIRSCSNMANALGKLRTEKFSAIIMGEHFSDGSGTQLYSALRKIPAHQDARVVVYTGSKALENEVKRWRHRDRNVTFVHDPQGANTVLDQITHLFSPSTAPSMG